MDPRVKPRAIAYDFFAAFRFVIPDGERSEPIRDPSIPAFGNQGEAGVLGSRLSRLTALGRDDKSKGRVICDSPAFRGRYGASRALPSRGPSSGRAARSSLPLKGGGIGWGFRVGVSL